MDEPIEEVYFNWLYSKVASVAVPTPSLTFLTLFRDLHNTEFVWLIHGDDNRAEDGLELRHEFHRNIRIDGDDLPWMHIPCSVLEMLIAFSRRAEFQTDMPARDWFWIFLKNLELERCSDAKRGVTQRVSAVLDCFIWRTYKPDGRGGMFPLSSYQEDQRKVEIWYQFCAYLVDQEI